jgi:sulfate permease, SulP family
MALIAFLTGIAVSPMRRDFAAANGPLNVIRSTASTISGIVQISLGTLRFGTVVKFIPFPVLAGFVNGLAVLIIWRELSHGTKFDGTELFLAVLGRHASINYVAPGNGSTLGGNINHPTSTRSPARISRKARRKPQNAV